MTDNERSSSKESLDQRNRQPSLDNPPSVSSPFLTILIPTKDRIFDLQRLLRSLENQSDKNFRILVVNNDGPEIAKAIESFSHDLSIRVVHDSTPNLSHLFNHALTSVDTNIVAYLNDDTEVNPSWVCEIKRTFTEYPYIAAVGGPALDQNRQLMQKTQKWMQGRLITRALFRVANSVLYEGKFFAIGYMSSWGTYSIGGSMVHSTMLPAPVVVNALSITNMAIRRDFLKRVGGFDETFKFSSADGDLFVRLRKKEAKLLFNSKLSVLHYSSSTQGNSGTRSAFWLSRDYFLFLGRLNPTGLSSRFKRGLVLAGAISFWAWHGISTGRPGLFVSSLDGMRAGLRVYLTGNRHYENSTNESSSTIADQNL